MSMFSTGLTTIERRIAQLEASGAPSDAAVFTRLLSSDFVAAAPLPSLAAASQAPAAIESLIESTAARYGVDPALVTSVVANESGFDPSAISKTGAQGLMQLMPGTAAELGVADPYDPAQNVDGGVRYLRALLDRFGGDARLAVAAYNAGPGAVERYDGVPPYAETQNYVKSVLDGCAGLRRG
jgi:soluble lytic murein transglycosylase-like protein